MTATGPPGGVAWAMGGPGRGRTVLAVIGPHIVIQWEPMTAWKKGSYMNAEEAEKAAGLMTAKMEREGAVLIAGPVAFQTTADFTSDVTHSSILSALGIR